MRSQKPRLLILLGFVLFAVPAAILAEERSELQVIWVVDGREMSFPRELRQVSPDDSLFTPQLSYIYHQLFSDGFFAGAVDSVSVKAADGRVILYASRGCRHRIENFRIELISELIDETESVQAAYSPFITNGNYFSSARVESEINRLIRHWENEGHMLVRIGVEEPTLYTDHCSAEVQLTVEPGPQIKVDGFILPELKRNDPDYIKTASGVRKGMVVTPNLLRDARLNLDNTGLFENTGTPQIAFNDGEFLLYFDLEEARTNLFDILVGYVPRPQGGNTIVGTGHLMLRNALFNGSTIDIRFERLQELVTRLDLSYDVRWIAGLPVGAGVHFNFIQQDSTYQVRNVGLNGRYSLSASTEIIGSLRNEAASVNRNPNQPIRELDSNAFFAGLGVEFRQTDSRRNPTRGLHGRVLVETGIKTITDERISDFTDKRRISQQEINGFLRGYINPFRRHVIAPSLHGYIMLSDIYTEVDLNRFGGAHTFRGYREDQFQSSRMLWADAEYRYLLDRNSHAFVFGALGYYERPRLVFELENSLKVNEWLYSWGMGFLYNTPIGIVKFTYAISAEDDFTNGKVHFGITTGF